MIKVFLAYSGHDRALLNYILEHLNLPSKRYDLWCYLPEINDFPMGRIGEIITDRDVFLLLLSKNSINSDNVRKELDLASERTQLMKTYPITIDSSIDDETEMKIPAFIKNNIYYSNPIINAVQIIEGILYMY